MNRLQNSNVKRRDQGFTLVEMLVSVVIFSLIVLAVYAFFDQGQWLYLHAERRSNIQDVARLAMEQLERDLRMIGSGVPTQGNIGGGTLWTPFIVTANGGSIVFRADIDAGNTMLLSDADGSGTIDVDMPTNVCPESGDPSVPILLVKSFKTWLASTCTGYSGDTIDVSASTTCSAEECEIYTPEHVFYRLSGDANNDGICDNIGNDAAPYCTLQRAEIAGNAPITTTADTDYYDVATNITKLQFTYLTLNDAVPTSNLIIQKIKVDLSARDRASEAQKTQDVNLSTTVMVRDSRY